MASTFSFDFNVNYSYENTDDLGSAQYQANTKAPFNLLFGTGDNQANTIFRDQFQLRTATWSKAYDLSALTDSFGVVKNFSAIKGIYIKNTSVDGGAVPGTIQALEDAANDFKGSLGAVAGSEIIILPGDIYQQSKFKTGWLVDATNEILTIGNAVNDDADFDLIIVGIAA